jgi:hypothetical protein
VRVFMKVTTYVNYRSSTAKLQERDELMRESWVKVMELRLVRAELDKCHKAEGVNHYENCRWLAEKYLHMMRENRVYFPGLCVLFLVDFDALVGERL